MDREDSLDLNNEEKPLKAQLEPVYPWKKAWQTLKVIWPQLVYISLVCMSIPQYLLFIFSTRKAFDLSQAFKINQAISLENGIRVLSEFAAHFISIGWLVAVLFLQGVFTAIALCGQVSRNETVSLPLALKTGARALFPKGLIFLFFVAILALLFLNISVQVFSPQIIKFLALIFGVLMSALPALMVIDRTRPIQSFRAAMGMKYASFTGMSKWSVFFLLLTYQLIAMNLVAIIEWANTSLLELDGILHVSRQVFFAASEAWPFGKAIYFVEGFSAIMLGFTTMLIVVLNASFIFELYRRHTLGRNISVVV